MIGIWKDGCDFIGFGLRWNCCRRGCMANSQKQQIGGVYQPEQKGPPNLDEMLALLKGDGSTSGSGGGALRPQKSKVFVCHLAVLFVLSGFVIKPAERSSIVLRSIREYSEPGRIGYPFYLCSLRC